MGAAKRRGSFEQRQKAAYDRIDAETQLIQQTQENTLELERLERKSAAMMNSNAAQFVTAYWKHSGIERRILRTSSFIDPSVIVAFKYGVDVQIAA